jgi:hypothetical protein
MFLKLERALARASGEMWYSFDPSVTFGILGV